MTEKGLLIVAVRVDDSRDVQRRMETILAAMSTREQPPDTTATAWCKPLSDLVAADLDRLAEFMGWPAVRDLNVGDVAVESRTIRQPPGETS